MVLQVAKDTEKEKEAGFADVSLPLPMVEPSETEYSVAAPARKKPCRYAYAFSIFLNIALIVAVVVLAVRVVKLQKQLRNAEEMELEPSSVVEHDDSVDVTAKVDQPSHDKINSMQKEYGTEWYRVVKCRILIVIFPEDSDGWLWW